MSTKRSHGTSLMISILLVGLSALSIYTTFLLYSVARRLEPYSDSPWQRDLDIGAFTFVGDDFPDHLPIDAGYFEIEGGSPWPAISMPLDETDSSYRLGPQNRMFTIAMFHELHCLEFLEEVIMRDEYRLEEVGHLQHCFNSLRQWTLCQPDLTLERSNFIRQGSSQDIAASTYTCRDWDKIYQHLVENYRTWTRFTVTQGWNLTDWYVVSYVKSVMQAGSV